MAAAEPRPPSGPGSENEDENILYDLLVNTEWPPETEVQPRGPRRHGASFIITRAITGTPRGPLGHPTAFLLPDGLVRLVSKQISWHLVLASNGKLLAAVQDQWPSSFSAVPKDPNPQWRRVAWSYDCTLLAYAESTGTVRVFDLMGSELFFIPPAPSSPRDLSYAIAGLIFLEYKASAQWSAELLVINYRGELRSYLVSVGTNQSYQESHSFSFSSHYPHGVNTAIYHPGHRLLLVGGCETEEAGPSEARGCGLSAWRVLSGSPYYKPVSCSGDSLAPKRLGLLRIFNVKLYSRQGQEQDGIYKMSLSPDGTILAAIHFSGKLSFWAVPSLRQLREWRQEEQPGYDAINPNWRFSTEKRKKIKDKESYYPLTDVSWWAGNAVTLARCSGALTVSSVKTLKNLLGKSCEWFEPSPQVTAAHDGGFLSLECEVRLAAKRPRLEARPGESEEADGDSDSEDSRLGAHPAPAKPASSPKSYRLVSLRSTTPEELYQRKIENEEYAEALSLAQAYGLDTDLVYQRQWRKSSVNVASIQNYLSKIKKRAWVLHECLERVPENVEAAKELLQYGLKGTDLEALLAIGRGEDDGRFILPGEADMAEVPYADLLSPAGEAENAEGRVPGRPELLRLVNFAELTLEQKELCRCRLKLLTYLDRLATYEEILAVAQAAEPSYDAEFFKRFRNQNIVLSARTYARESNVPALGILFTYHGAELLAHRLAMLSNFPETTSPHEYAALLPEACHRALWEQLFSQTVVEPSPPDEGGFLYEAQPELLRYRTARPSIELVTDWYCARGQEIELYARQVDCALSLIRLGMERNVPGLLRLCDDLVTLETLVYEAGCDLTLTLRDLQQMKAIDQLRLLMDSSSEEKFVTNAYQWMVPLLHRFEKQSPGAASQLLKDYLVAMAQGDLRPALKIFQHSKPDLQQKIIPDQDQLMEIALECIYNCERDDQLSCCYDILECLPQRGYGPVTAALHDKVDQLERILSVSELLEKHGLQKPVSFVKNTQAHAEEARNLMIRLTRHTGRKQPPVSESHWKMLLQDMLAMQRMVYTCLEPETCYEIFTESLLCSSRLDTLHLAGQLMQCSAGGGPGSSPPKAKVPFRVGYEKSVALVLAASREYFNSSTNLADSCMDLARACLQLITDCPPAVQEELDLIRALGYLEEFGVKSLPLQVRLCPDRLGLIRECIAQAPTCYRQSAKLLGLAALLQVAGEDHEERKGQVLVLLVQQALHFQDYKAASMHCQELMAAGYSPSWDVCSQLGQCESFQDLAARQELMAFALTHCPPSSIECLLAASSSLQTEILYQRVNFQMCPSEGGENPNVSILPAQCLNKGPLEVSGEPSHSGDLLHWTTATTRKVLSNTGTTTRAVLHAVSDAQWWKKSLAYLRPLHGQDFCDVYGRGAGANAGLEKQGCHPFYESLLANPFVSEVSAALSACSDLLRAPEVLLRLASDAFPHDMTLALAYLLALPQVSDANKCFEKQPPSALCLQLAALYYSLHIYSLLLPCFKDSCHPLYRADPSELIRTVTEYVSGLDGRAWPEELAGLVQQLAFYHERLLDLTQAQLLQGLRKGVDVARFAADDQYKRETILGLAETLESNVYNVALSLAQRYNVPRWELYMTHLEFLFTDSSLSTAEIEGRAQDLGLFETLKTEPELFHERMAKYVYPGIGGTDHERLLYFFSLLAACGCPAFGRPALAPDIHVRLLKKLKVVAAGLNYKKLTDGTAPPLEALEPVLTSQNILSISKLASRIPEPDGSALSPSSLYTIWLQKLFWKGDPQLLREAPRSVADWLHAYDACAKYFDRLHPGDLLVVLDAMTFSPKALTKLTVDSRTEMTRRAVGTVKHFIEKHRKKHPERDSEDPTASTGPYEDALRHLEQSLAHLQTLHHGFVASLRSSELDALRRYADRYDLSRSERAKIEEQAVAMCLDGQPLAMVQQLLEVAVGPLDLTARMVVRGAGQPWLAVASWALKAVSDQLLLLPCRENLLSSDDLLEWFRPFCADDTLPVKPRVQVLQSMERSFQLSDEDRKLLVFFRTEAILKATWPQTQVSVADIENEQGRSSLFLGLLEASHERVEFQHLALLLQAWPPMKSLDHGQDHGPWVKLAAVMLSRCTSENKEALGQDVLALCRSLYHTPQMLPLECVKELALLLLNQNLLLPALKLLLESQDADLQALALEQIAAVAQVDDSSCDPELLSLLLDAKLAVRCISTPFYRPLVDHLLAHQRDGPWSVDETARQLREAGHSVEAGSLLLASRGVYSALRTFSAALGAARDWI
uniref:NBAS subunit of NRZ tethering complex n=1 Tax=Sarcophilus harrisii TaxID=9305 RepID=A0A7N4P366_SARHA